MNHTKLIELLRRLIDESGGNNAAARKLGIRGPYLSQIMSEERSGEGGKVVAGLLRLYPNEASALYGGAVPSDEPGAAAASTEIEDRGGTTIEYPERYPNRALALQRYAELYGSAGLAAITSEADKVRRIALQAEEDPPPAWWFETLQGAARELRRATRGHALAGRREVDPEDA